MNLDVVENNPILTIKDNGKIDILYGDNSDFFYCSNDGIIATDESDYLYFSANRNVYKVNNDKQTEKVADFDELEKTNPNNFNKNGMIKGIVVKNHKIYLDVNFSKIPERYISKEYMPKKTEDTLPVALLSMNGELGANFQGIMALSVITTLPVAVLFLIAQKRVMEGMAAGAVKG